MPFVTHAYNTSVQVSPWISPFQALYGRDPQIPPESSIDIHSKPTNMDGATWGLYLQQMLPLLRHPSSRNLQVAQQRQKRHYEVGQITLTYDDGTKSLFTSRSGGTVSVNHSCTDGSAHSPWFVQSNPRLTCSDAIAMVDSPPPIFPASSPMLPQAHLLALVLSPCRKTPCFS